MAEDSGAFADRFGCFPTSHRGNDSRFHRKNLSQAVISHCGIRFETAAGYKTEVNAFLDKMIAVSPVSAAKVAEGFYYHA